MSGVHRLWHQLLVYIMVVVQYVRPAELSPVLCIDLSGHFFPLCLLPSFWLHILISVCHPPPPSLLVLHHVTVDTEGDLLLMQSGTTVWMASSVKSLRFSGNQTCNNEPIYLYCLIMSLRLHCLIMSLHYYSFLFRMLICFEENLCIDMMCILVCCRNQGITQLNI